MRIVMTALLAVASAWVTGTVVLIGAALVMFRHAAGRDHPTGDFQFVDHDAPGIVFGDILAHWLHAISIVLLPLLVLGATGGMLLAVKRRRTGLAALWLVGMVLAAGLHAWSVSVTARMNLLIANIHAGHVQGSERSEFHTLHGQSMTGTAVETLIVLIIGMAAAFLLMRGDSASAAPSGA